MWSEKRDLQRAIADFDKAIELDSHLAEAYANRGLMRVRLGQNAEAEKDFAESLRLDSSLKPRIEQIRPFGEGKSIA